MFAAPEVQRRVSTSAGGVRSQNRRNDKTEAAISRREDSAVRETVDVYKGTYYGE